MSKKILIAYFSHSGNTQEIANRINEFVGGDVFRIEPVENYPSNYQEVLKVTFYLNLVLSESFNHRLLFFLQLYKRFALG